MKRDCQNLRSERIADDRSIFRVAGVFQRVSLFPRDLRIAVAIALIAAIAVIGSGSGNAITGRALADSPREPGPAYVRSGFAYGIMKREAVLVGFVNAQGLSTTVFFEVGFTKAYGRQFPIGESERFYTGYHRSEVEEGVTTLRPGTTYHFRLVATNAAGTSYGKDETFKTRPR